MPTRATHSLRLAMPSLRQTCSHPRAITAEHKAVTQRRDKTMAEETVPDNNDAADGREPFAVRDAATANWLVRKVKELRAYAAHVKVWAERELRVARRDEKFLLARYGPQLQAWVERRC